MEMKLTITKASIDDKDFIIQAQKEMALETEGVELNPDRVGAGVAAVFSDSHKGQYWISKLNDEIVASLLVTREWSDWRDTYVWWIQSVYVRPSFRGQGIYKKMYQHLQAEARSFGVAGIRLYVDKTNVLASQVYQKLGMQNQHYDLFEWLRFT